MILFDAFLRAFIEVYFHTIKPPHSVIINIFTGLCNHQYNLILEHFHRSKKKKKPNFLPFAVIYV